MTWRSGAQLRWNIELNLRRPARPGGPRAKRCCRLVTRADAGRGTHFADPARPSDRRHDRPHQEHPMNRFSLAATAALTVLAAAGTALGNPSNNDDRIAESSALRIWNQQALDAVRPARSSDADAARTYAMVDAAIYDTVNGVVSRGPFGR